MKNEPILTEEEKFHDDWAHTIAVDQLPVDANFEACTSPENKMIMKHLGDIRGRKILEIGCGAGEASVYFAKKGADVTATDISTAMLEVAQKLAGIHQVHLLTKQCTSEHLPFPDESFDVVYGANILHHVSVDEAVAEITRVLKPGGFFTGYEPLAYNPVINIYRKIASEVRTPDEHPLKTRDIRLLKTSFSAVTTKGKWLFTLLVFIKFYFIDRVNPNKERYWKKIITDHQQIQPLYLKLEKMDAFVLKHLPFLWRYCWNIVIIAKK